MIDALLIENFAYQSSLKVKVTGDAEWEDTTGKEVDQDVAGMGTGYDDWYDLCICQDQ